MTDVVTGERATAEAGERHIDLSILTVTFNSDDALLCRSLETAVRSARAAGLVSEVVVVDNGSDRFPVVPPLGLPTLVMRSEANVGFGSAVNMGVRGSRGDFVYCINPDTATSEKALRLLMDRAIRPGRRLVAGFLMVNGAPQVDASLLWLFSTERLLHRSAHRRMLSTCLERPFIRVRKVCGGAFLARRAELLMLGPFDEDFFLYSEDSDLSIRAALAGFALELIPAAEISHVGAASVKEHGRLVERARVDGSLRLVAKHRASLRFVATVELWLITVLGLVAPRLTSSGSQATRRARFAELRRWSRRAVPDRLDPISAVADR